MNPRTSIQQPAQVGWSAADPMWVAARQTLAYHFEEMCVHEPETIRGQDPEALHDMRVATRRIRAALSVFGDFIEADSARTILKGVRRTGRALGAVRDLDVFWGKAQNYLETIPETRRDELAPLELSWRARRSKARDRMLTYLSDKRYTRFKDRFHRFLASPHAWKSRTHNSRDEPIPYRVQHVAPREVHDRLGIVLAYGEWVHDRDTGLLHQLRISVKRLRYTLEFFRAALMPPVEEVIEELKLFQDHLGDLQDAVVAIQMVEVFLQTMADPAAHDSSATEAQKAGIRVYLDAKIAERDRLLESFPEAWAAICDLRFREAVAQTILIPS